MLQRCKSCSYGINSENVVFFRSQGGGGAKHQSIPFGPTLTVSSRISGIQIKSASASSTHVTPCLSGEGVSGADTTGRLYSLPHVANSFL